MIKHSIFSENTQKEIERAAAKMAQYPYFENNGGWCGELLLIRQDVPAALQALRLGMRYADLVGVERDMVPLVYIFQMLPKTVERLVRAGFSDKIVEDSLRDVETWIDVYRAYHHGRCGLERLEWAFRLTAGLVYRMGEFQFERVTYEFPYYLYQNRGKGNYMAFAAPGLYVDQDGYLEGTNGRLCRYRRETELSFSAEYVQGFTVDLQKGIVETEKTASLSLKEWGPVLIPGMKALTLHIPAGADLSEEKLLESLRMAMGYFGKEIGLETSLILCDSWLLDPHLEELLPENGRICSFMRKFYKLPVKEQVPQIFERVMGFDFKRGELESFQAITSLQKHLKNYILGGGEVFTTAGFLPNRSALPSGGASSNSGGDPSVGESGLKGK